MYNPILEESTVDPPRSFKEYVNQGQHHLEEQEQKQAVICVDNKAALQIIQNDGGSWRTRHLRVRSAAIKDRADKGQLEAVHTPGKVQLADLNTKSHG